MGWREPDFLFTGVCELQTKRKIENLQRFVYSKANMNPDAIELENKFHAELKGAYILVLKEPMISDDLTLSVPALHKYGNRPDCVELLFCFEKNPLLP